MPFRSKCVKCQKEGQERQAVLRWTLFNGQISVVAPLCMEHGGPLSELVNIAGPKPNLQTGSIPKAPVRLPKARPLTGWVKPEDD
jgi:hypothetical protein